MPNLTSQTEPSVSVAPVESSLGRQSYQNIVYKYTKNRENQFYHLNCRLNMENRKLKVRVGNLTVLVNKYKKGGLGQI